MRRRGDSIFLQPVLLSCACALAVASGACGDGSTSSQLQPSGSVSSSGSGQGGSGQGGGTAGASSSGNAAGGAGQGGSGGGFNPSGSGSGGSPPCSNELVGVIRDFQISHPDFEGTTGVDPGIVEPDLGADLKPIYAGPSPTTSNAANFNQWYRDVAGVNIAIPFSIPLTEMSPGVYTYENNAFFPIDGQGFGNEGNVHNYHFTYEIHAEFEYIGGEIFTFSGDDDVFTFINGKLAIDLGGVHGSLSQSINLDDQAGALGIQVGGVYALDFFFAERHTSESNFRIDTGIACFTEVQPPS